MVPIPREEKSGLGTREGVHGARGSQDGGGGEGGPHGRAIYGQGVSSTGTGVETDVRKQFVKVRSMCFSGCWGFERRNGGGRGEK